MGEQAQRLPDALRQASAKSLNVYLSCSANYASRFPAAAGLSVLGTASQLRDSQRLSLWRTAVEVECSSE
ncbi:hypothetical protein KIN20_008434 [Parelaphostrongylus tenuis]|uniref:Uncharacterized protein n=1 Tax=Parelaphostrongylus tenuis TaxID=148309 RepID=A0AAD5QJU7_PARTN|nr:hypothetical protein KIN20_008434 [Parelaphostrongylus tenuis]